MGDQIWRDIPGYEGLYLISREGEIKSLIGWNGQKHVRREKILSGWVQKAGNSGYKRRVVSLTKNGVRKYHKVHQLVAKTFIANPNDCDIINHIDGDPLNNSVSNLEWCTQKQNVDHAIRTGLVYVGAYEHEKEIVEMYKQGKSVSRICKAFNTAHKTVIKVLKRNGLDIREPGFYQDKYNIDKKELVKEFEKGSRNVDIAKKFGTNRLLIGSYKHNWRKGELVK